MDSESDGDSENGPASSEEDSKSVADRLDTAATVIWAAFLALIVVLALIPVAGVLAGVAPFAPPDPTPYVGFVGLAVVGTALIVGVAIWDA
jgi:hypothetical protein